MSLIVTGKIIMQDTNCVKCNCLMKVYSSSKAQSIKCATCGAYYELSRAASQVIPESELEFVYEFKEFKCVHVSFLTPCDNTCPTLGMYCKEHVSDKYIEEVQRDIASSEQRLLDAKNKLDRVYESKKTWLIEKLSRIDEQEIDSDK